MSRLAAVVLLATACSSAPDAPRPPPPAAPPLGVPHDASTAAVGTAIVAFDPLSGMHLDDDPPVRTAPSRPTPPRQHPIDVTLRSSPPGALAAVDGVPVGITPTFWPGDANGREHEFTFVLGGYAVARYRFVPVTSGTIHARLDAVNDELDGGIEPVPAWTNPPGGTVLAPPPPVVVAPVPVPVPRPAPRPAIDAAAAPDGDDDGATAASESGSGSGSGSGSTAPP